MQDRDGPDRDGLVGVELIKFSSDLAAGNVDANLVNIGAAPADPATVNEDADDAVPYLAGITVDAGQWFTVPSGSTAEFGLTGNVPTGFSIDSASGAITVPGALAATVPVTVTVSTVSKADVTNNDGADVTFDDVSHTVMIIVPATSSRSVDFPNEEGGTVSGDQAHAPADGAECFRPHEPENFEVVTPTVGDGDYFGL